MSNFNSFIFGKVLNYNDKHFIISAYTPEGRYDGFILKEIDCILQVVTEDKYSKKMEMLIQAENSAHDEKNMFDDKDLIISALSQSQKMEWIVAV